MTTIWPEVDPDPVDEAALLLAQTTRYCRSLRWIRWIRCHCRHRIRFP